MRVGKIQNPRRSDDKILWIRAPLLHKHSDDMASVQLRGNVGLGQVRSVRVLLFRAPHGVRSTSALERCRPEEQARCGRFLTCSDIRRSVRLAIPDEPISRSLHPVQSESIATARSVTILPCYW